MQVDEMLRRVTDKTKIVIVANPNNPTGTYLPDSELRRLHAGLPEHVLLVVDGAYAEYVTREDYSCGLELARSAANVVVTRTFSKIYGLPALRIGWAYASPAIIDAVQRIRTPFNTNAAALAAAAAAVKDVDYTRQQREHNAAWLERIRESLTALGLYVVPSVTNFYLMRFPENSDKTASGAADYLKSRGIIPRPVGSENDPHLRITVGSDSENEAVLAALTDYMNG